MIQNKILIINSSTDKNLVEYIDKIKRIVNKFNFSSDCIHYKDIEKTNLDSYLGIIIAPAAMGKSKDTEKEVKDEWQDRINHSKLLTKCNKPMLGICAGHQLLGLLYGSKYEKGIGSEKGNNCIVEIIDKQDRIFENISETTLKVKQQHNNSISLPEEFKLLASSEKCQTQIIKHKKYPIYGTQFHAEENEILINNFLSIIKISL